MPTLKRALCPACTTVVVPHSDGECPRCGEVSPLGEYSTDIPSKPARAKHSCGGVVKACLVVGLLGMLLAGGVKLVGGLSPADSTLVSTHFNETVPRHVAIVATILDIVLNPISLTALLSAVVVRVFRPRSFGRCILAVTGGIFASVVVLTGLFFGPAILAHLQGRLHASPWPLEHINSIGMTFKLIPAGKFMMGSPDDETGRNDDEGPVHSVRITQPYYIGIHEVTQEQYQRIMEDTPSRFFGPTNPVENVSWNEAVEFCRRLSERENRQYCLPTEAQWEYACRAGTTTSSYWGDGRSDNEIRQHCWYERNADAPCWTQPHPFQEGTQPVGEKLPNEWGLYDMNGNVLEWCADWYSERYYGKSPPSDPTGPHLGSRRALRGSGWRGEAASCRSAFRLNAPPDFRNEALGFRVVLVPSDAKESQLSPQVECLRSIATD